MNTKKFFKSAQARMALGAVIVSLVAGTAAYADDFHPGVTVTVAPNVFAAQDDYVYYPGYNVYYSSHLHKYAYQENGAWVSRSEPRGVSIDVLHAAPSVKMDFHDSPANHHEDIVKRYPKNWSPAHDVSRDDHHDDHGDRKDR